MERTISVNTNQRSLRRNIRFFEAESLVFAFQNRPDGAETVITIGPDIQTGPHIERTGIDQIVLDRAALAPMPEGATWAYNIWLVDADAHVLVLQGLFSKLESLAPNGPSGPLVLTGTPPARANAGAPWLFQPGTSGGVAPYRYALSAGNLPTAFSLDASSGTITGTPNIPGTWASLELTVTDAMGATASLGPFDIVVAPGVTADPAVLLITAGGANAAALGTQSAIAPASAANLTDVQILDASGTAWRPYQPGVTANSADAPTLWGPEAAFAVAFRAAYPTRPLYIVKIAEADSALVPGGPRDWSPTTPSAAFGTLESQVTAAKGLLGAASLNHETVTLWTPCEADSETATAFATYFGTDGTDGAWAAFVNAYRNRIDDTGSFIVVRPRPYTGYTSVTPAHGLRALKEQWADDNSWFDIVDADFNNNFSILHPGPSWIDGVGARAFSRWNGDYSTRYGALDIVVPTNLGFAATNNQSAGSLVTTAMTEPLAGMNRSAAITITGGTYRIVNDLDNTVYTDWTSTPGRVHPYQRIELRTTASTEDGGQVDVEVSVGGTSATWQVTTAAARGLSTREGMLAAAAATFDDAGSYPSGTGFDIASGNLSFSPATTSNVLSNALNTPFVTGRTYSAYMYLSDRVTGSARFRAANPNSLQGNAITAPRRYIETFVSDRDYIEFGVRGQVFEGTVAEVQAYDITDQINGPIDIYICAGQSNMVGASGETGFDLALEEPEFRALGISGTSLSAFGYATDGSGPTINANLSASEGIGTIRPLVNPITHSSANYLGVSPVASMARTICDATGDGSPTPLFACVAAGGTDLFTEWNAATDGRTYDLMVANVNAVLARNPANRVAGMFWCQGESSNASGYAAQFRTMIDALRASWGAFPLVILEHGGIPGQTGFDNMQAEHLKSATGSGDVSELADCVYVDRPASAALESDNIHYTGTSNRQRGTDAAQAMLALI